MPLREVAEGLGKLARKTKKSLAERQRRKEEDNMKKYKLIYIAPCFIFAIIALIATLALKNRLAIWPEEGPTTVIETVELNLIIGSAQRAELTESGKESQETIETTAESTIPEPASATMPSFKPYSFIPLSSGLQDSIHSACADYEIAYDLILAMIKTESEFRPNSIGDNGNSYGLMQIQPRWWDKFAAERGLADYRADPAQNAELGIAILSYLLAESGGDLDKALIAYNGSADYPARVYANYEWILNRKEGN